MVNAYYQKTPEQILSKDFITKTEIQVLFRIGEKKAKEIFEAVQAQVEKEGKLNIAGRVSWRRMYKMLGLPEPKEVR